MERRSLGRLLTPRTCWDFASCTCSVVGHPLAWLLAAWVGKCQRRFPGSCPIQRLLPTGELPRPASSGGAGGSRGGSRR